MKPPKKKRKPSTVSRGKGIKGLNWETRCGFDFKPIVGGSLAELERRLAAI